MVLACEMQLHTFFGLSLEHRALKPFLLMLLDSPKHLSPPLVLIERYISDELLVLRSKSSSVGQ